MSRYLTKAGNAFEARIICERLAEAGIPAQVQGFIEGGMSAGDIYVDERNLDNAREILKTAQDVSEEELIELSEQSAHQVGPAMVIWMSGELQNVRFVNGC
jgi:hypothetical protein